MSKIVIALGGNALGKDPKEQLKLLEGVAKIIVDLVKGGNRIVLTHGNGPQVGIINLAFENSHNKVGDTPYNFSRHSAALALSTGTPSPSS